MFTRTYQFLASVLPYTNAEWEKLSIFLNFLISKLPAPIEQDLSKGILEAIDIYFQSDNWDFGETFFMTELLAFIHQEMAPNIQTVVSVPKSDTESFGRLFQIRSEPDQLFISATSAEDIEVVNSFTDEELRIGVII